MAIQIRSFDNFASAIARELELASVPRRPDRLRNELSFDSLALFELYVVISEMGAVVEPEVLAEPGLTLGDLYDRVTVAVIDRDVANTLYRP